MHTYRTCVPHARACNAQVGSGDRSEKIKTYNYKDSRVSDHRLKMNFDLNSVMEGGIEECIMSMVSLDQQERLQALAADVAM